MANFRSDTLIRQMRKRRGLTQEQLAEGICSKDTLSRIESGTRPPSRHVFNSLMQRLGENPDRYYKTLVTADDLRVMETRDTITQLVKDDKFEEAGKILAEAEKDPAFEDEENRQFLIRTRATIAQDVDKDYPRAYALALEAISLTRPRFNENDIASYVLTYDEIATINTLALLYAEERLEMGGGNTRHRNMAKAQGIA